MFKTLSHAFVSLIFPQECHLCSVIVESPRNGVACDRCWSQTRIFDGNETLCNKCGAFLFGTPSRQASRCHECADLLFDRAFAVGLYEHALAALVVDMKTRPRVPQRLRELINKAIDRVGLRDSDLLVPVPLSPKRKRERGFNQAQLIAAVVAGQIDAAIDQYSLVREIHTPIHRVGMDRKARALTVKNAFRVIRPKLIEGRRVLLVDDVLTSGETASTCARVLKRNGAATVSLFTIARAG